MPRTPDSPPFTIDPGTIAQLLDAVRSEAPLVQCLTNAVVSPVTANLLLALGAAPAMVDIPVEAGEFAPLASAVLVNLGTPRAEQRAAMREAASAARVAGTPWVLDPVAVGGLSVRTALARELLAQRPTAIRGNASEILALAGGGRGGRGVDAVDDVESATGAARALANETGAVVAVSGPDDFVTDGEREAFLGNGHVLLTRMTGGGCALGAVVAAFLGVHSPGDTSTAAADSFTATVAAHVVYGIAAELAATTSDQKAPIGPGGFAVRLLDALSLVDAALIRERSVIR